MHAVNYNDVTQQYYITILLVEGLRLLLYEVVAPCYQHYYKVPQLHTTKV